MAFRYRNGGCVLRLFTDTVTIFNKTTSNNTVSWVRTVVKGVMWSDTNTKSDNGGRVSVSPYTTITFPKGTYDGLVLNPANEEDAIFYGEITATIADVKGSRISDLMKQYPKCGRIKSVNDNSNRTYLKNIKVVVA